MSLSGDRWTMADSVRGCFFGILASALVLLILALVVAVQHSGHIATSHAMSCN
jgi:hypothetical protein